MLLRTLQCFYWILREKDRERDWELGLIFPKFSLNKISEALFATATPSVSRVQGIKHKPLCLMSVIISNIH